MSQDHQELLGNEEESTLLTKGLEEEVYTGTPDGRVVGMSHQIAADLPGFATEPDSRNVEYTTAPYRSYRLLLDRLMAKRCRLRRYLVEKGGYTLVPGSTLSLEESSDFHISNPANPYYQHIAKIYGTTVVTASTHINIGIGDPEELIRALRVVRAEAALFLALTASSPFLHGKPTGAHSTRWLVFPETPQRAPFFTSHEHFRQWIAEQLSLGTMFNPRHLWLSIRPNGLDTPDQIVRLELRICDRIVRPHVIGAVTALLEARVWQVLEDSALDPLAAHNNEKLVTWARSNEVAAARSSLDSMLIDWRTGREIPAKTWIRELYEGARETASRHGFLEFLEPLEQLLAEGNLAQRWLREVAAGRSPQEVITGAIRELNEIDTRYDPDCPSV